MAFSSSGAQFIELPEPPVSTPDNINPYPCSTELLTDFSYTHFILL